MRFNYHIQPQHPHKRYQLPNDLQIALYKQLFTN